MSPENHTGATAPPTETEKRAAKPAKLVRPGPDGHRQRLRGRFMDGMGKGLDDYELLELVLMGAIPRADVRALARHLIKELGSLGAVLAAPLEQLRTFPGLGPAGITTIKVVEAVGRRAAHQELTGRHVLENWRQLMDYCLLNFRHDTIERCHGIALNRKNHILRHVELSIGTVDRVTIFVPEVVKALLNEGASSAVLVHNHPSGDAKPSQADIRITQDLVSALRGVNISLHDHLIIARTATFSFRSAGLLPD